MVKEGTALAEAGGAPAVGIQDSVLAPVGSGSGRVCRTEQSQAGYSERGGQVHWTRIVGDQ